MGAILWMQQFVNPVLDQAAQWFSFFAEDTIAVLIVTLYLWCFDKEFGYRMGIVLIGGSSVNGCLKNLFKVPRPWERGVEGYMEPLRKSTATGYSFPSGHTQIAASNAAMLVKRRHKLWIHVLLALYTVLVGLSRIYCRVHTWQDVVAGLAVAVVCVLLIDMLVVRLMKTQWGMLLLIPAALLMMVFFRDADLYKSCGIVTAVAVGYCVETKWIRFDVKAKWWAHILKMAIGIGLVLAIRLGGKALLGTSLAADFFRYHLMGMFITCGAPWLYQKLFGRIPC